jgi:hypothetical protein
MTTTPTASYLSIIKVGNLTPGSATAVGGVTSAKFGRKGALKEITALGDAWVRRHRTIKDATLSLDCTEALDDPGQVLIEAAWASGADIPVVVYRGASHYWVGNMKVENADENSQAGDNVDTITYTLAASDGAGLSYT